ncbi:StbB family protein [Variovorax sp. J22P168]|uniref:StbB family protein n=1 Tax=Variovorax jilinensis TaxID=3053513 RepID=UPI002576EDE5|nr:StbB family protein [Variovorax sp. J22P168]MDM0015839.1 StbB family protein [Variovorax sp. J22P168]
MKVAIINFSGNVGKTTVARQLLAPRMDAPEFVFESINAGGDDDLGYAERLKGKEFAHLQKQLIALDSAVIDVGASNIEEVMKQIARFEGSHEDFDFYVVPVTNEKKQKTDTVATIQALAALGVAPTKIRLLFNRVDIESADDLRSDFGALFALHARSKNFTLNTDAAIYENDLFDRLPPGKSVAAVFADETDYRAQFREAKSESAKAQALEMMLLQRLSKAATKNLDAAFDALFK